MSFLIQRSAGRGLTLAQVPGAVLRIGRGTNQQLRSENPAVALDHAIVEKDAAGYFITDKGSITGTYVNRKPVESARLGKGDVIEIGDLRIEVQMADPVKPLFLRVITSRAVVSDAGEEEEKAASVATPGARVVKAKKVDYGEVYRLHRPWLTKLSLTAILLIAGLAVLGEVIRPDKQIAFMPGGLSSAHARARDARGNTVANACGACHTPWNSVTSSKCLDCHPHQPHAQHETSAPDCFSCHSEHRGATKLASIADQSCTGCHANLAEHVRLPKAQLASLRFASGRYSFDQIARITSFGEAHPEIVYGPDRNTLRFNHKLHLAPRGVFNSQGKREVLQCASCHSMVTDKGKTDPVAIDFEKHCQQCHRLTFDARFPNAEVPHGGEPGIVYGFVLATYSGDRDIAGKPAAEVRRILSARRTVAPDQRAVLNAEQVIKTKCRLCHEIQRKGERLAVTPPVIPSTWLDRAKFTHGRHSIVECEKCHQGVRQSVPTSDVLMPRRSECTDCHAENARGRQAASTCVTCHEYHLRPQRRTVTASLASAGVSGLGRGGRMLQGILLATIVILLLVVLIPVGIALFQRLRPERPAAGAPARPPAPAPPPAAVPDMPTDRMGVPPAAAAPAAPPPSPPSAMKGTEIAPIPERPGEPVQAGTEMVQWYGMLNCTSGPLDGQRFVIEEDGVYIGRDPALSKIVIPDTRVSKRHVRLLPRDGKVWAVDQESTNGTFVNDQRIGEVQLKRGDTIVLADNAATFVYQI